MGHYATYLLNFFLFSCAFLFRLLPPDCTKGGPHMNDDWKEDYRTNANSMQHGFEGVVEMEDDFYSRASTFERNSSGCFESDECAPSFFLG